MEAKSIFQDLKNEVLNTGIKNQYYENEFNDEVLGIDTLEEDITIFIINSKNKIGINYTWGNFEIIDMNTKEYLSSMIVDKYLTNKVNWNGAPKDMIKDISKVIKKDIELKADNDIEQFGKNKLSIDDKIHFLNDFIKRWGLMDMLMDETLQFEQNASLQAEYSEFLKANNFPEMSADELVNELNKFNELIGQDVLMGNSKTKIINIEYIEGDSEYLVVDFENNYKVVFIKDEFLNNKDIIGKDTNSEDEIGLIFNYSVMQSDLLIGSEIQFLNGAKKMIDRSELDLAGKIGYINEINEVGFINVKLNEKIEVLNEWDNQLIFTDGEEMKEFLSSFIILGVRDMNVEIEEKDVFSDADKFVEEFSDYLIGKNVDYDGGQSRNKIIKIQTHSHENGTSNVEIILEGGSSHYLLTKRGDLQLFIDGEIINSGDDDFSFNLILQEDKQEDLVIEDNKINHPEFRYYVLSIKKRKLSSGYEYKEDALERFEDLHKIGDSDYLVISKKELINQNIDPDDNSNWLISSADYSIINEALDYAVSQNDFDEESKNAYIEKYKNEGKYLTVIKANLIYYFSHIEKDFKNSIMNSQFEKSLKLKDTMERISNELLNIIKKDI